MLSVEVGEPIEPDVRKAAASFVTSGGTVADAPVDVDGLSGVRFDSLSRDLNQPRHGVAVMRGSQMYFIMAAGVGETDVSAAFDQVIRSWRWTGAK